MAGVIDGTNLGYLWSKMKSYVASQIQAVGALTGVKGAAESSYRTGNVSISPEDIGLHEVSFYGSGVEYSSENGPLTFMAGTNLEGSVVTDPSTGKQTVAFDVDNIGDYYANSGSYRIATADIDTYTNGPHVTLPAGSYMFVGAWTFNSASASGDRNMQVGIRSGASGDLWGERVRIRQSSGNYAILNVSALRTFTATTTVYLAGSASITSGNGSCYITAIRIA